MAHFNYWRMLFAWVLRTSPMKWLSVAAVGLAIVDTFVTPVSAAALTLLVLAALPWLLPFFGSLNIPIRKMKLPGGLEFEFHDFETITKMADRTGLLVKSDKPYSFQSIYERDAGLALAGLRIELEKRLRELAVLGDIDNRHGPITRLIGELNLAKGPETVIRELLPLLNKASHAIDLDERYYTWAMEVGPKILAGLDESIQSRTPT